MHLRLGPKNRQADEAGLVFDIIFKIEELEHWENSQMCILMGSNNWHISVITSPRKLGGAHSRSFVETDTSEVHPQPSTAHRK